MVGINVPIPVPLAHYTFGGWKRSAFGDLNQHGPDAVRFCEWAVAHKEDFPSSYLARLYWNNVINNLTARTTELDTRKYISLVNQSDTNDPFVIFADISKGDVAWKVIQPDDGGVAHVNIVAEEYSFYFLWNHQRKVYKTTAIPIGFSSPKAYVVKIRETDLQITPTTDYPPGRSSEDGLVISFDREDSLINPPEMLPVHIMADGSDIWIIPTFPFQRGIFFQTIDKTMIS